MTSKEDTRKVTEISTRPNPQACLFVASLCSSKTDQELVSIVSDHFHHWGKLINVKVLRDYMNRPYSFVQFERIEDAAKALKEANNNILNGRRIRIEKARVNRTLFLGKMKGIKPEEIKKVCETFGPVEELTLLQDAKKTFRGTCFCKYEYREDAVEAFHHLKDYFEDAIVEWATNVEKKKEEKNTIFIGQLNPILITREALEKRFGKYGKLEHVVLVNKYPTKKSAFAFIQYQTEKEAQKAIQVENHQIWLDQVLKVQFRGSENELYDEPPRQRTTTFELPLEFYPPNVPVAAGAPQMYGYVIPQTPQQQQQLYMCEGMMYPPMMYPMYFPEKNE